MKRNETLIRNLTPHEVTVHTLNGMLHIPPMDEPARVVVSDVADQPVPYFGTGTTLPVTLQTRGRVENLPPTRPGVMNIVSRAVAVACPDRDDLLVPDQPIIEDGRIVGCRRLVRFQTAPEFRLTRADLDRFDATARADGYAAPEHLFVEVLR